MLKNPVRGESSKAHRIIQRAIRLFCSREMLAYLFWGAASVLFNVGVFALLVAAGIEYKIANLLTLALLKIFVFVTNKIFVFKTAAKGIMATIKEFFRFLAARFVTNLIDFFGLIFLVEVVRLEANISKIMLGTLVVALNFIFSKWFVFTAEKNIQPQAIFAVQMKNQK